MRHALEFSGFNQGGRLVTRLPNSSNRHLIADGTMWPHLIVQHDDRTPTGPRFASLCIRGIPGPDGSFTCMMRCPKGRIFSAAAFLVLLLVDFLRSRRGCSTDQ